MLIEQPKARHAQWVVDCRWCDGILVLSTDEQFNGWIERRPVVHGHCEKAYRQRHPDHAPVVVGVP